MKQVDRQLVLVLWNLQRVSSESEQTKALQRGCIHDILTMTDEGVICFNFYGVN